jgi:hypothetical protein
MILEGRDLPKGLTYDWGETFSIRKQLVTHPKSEKTRAQVVFIQKPYHLHNPDQGCLVSYHDAVTNEIEAALDLFQKARLISSLRRVWFRILGYDNCLFDMKQFTDNMELIGWGYVGVQNIPIGRIVGVEDICVEFDRGFYPLRGCCKTRWLQAALEHQTDLPCQPVVLTQINSHYYVQEGIYRISVTRARGRKQISAYVNCLKLVDEKDILATRYTASKVLTEGMDRSLIGTPQI